MAFEPILQSLDGAEAMLVPYKFFNGAIIVVFAFLVPLLTLEINYFRLAVFRNWYAGERDKRRRARRRHKRPEDDVRSDSVSSQSAERSNRPVSTLVCEIENASILGDSRSHTQDCMQQTQALQYDDDASWSSSIGEGTISSILLDNVLSHAMANSHVRDSASISGLSSKYATSCHSQDHVTQTQQQYQQSRETALTGAYSHIRKASFSTISFWMALYLATAAGIAFSTRGLEEKVVAIIGGASKFMSSLLLFIVSAKIPQWLGVYHQGSILLVKHSSPYSLHLQHLDLTNLSDLALLKTHVRMGVGFHFAKFYVVLMPFYCGSNGMSVVCSMLLGVVVGFILMWFVFMVHKKYIHHRNVVASSTIFILVAISSLTFVRGMAWIQVVWRKHIFDDDDALLAISFFSWLVLLISVHMLFLWHTVKVEKKKRNADVRRDDVENDRIDDNQEDTAEMVDVINLPRTRKINKSPSVVAGLPRQPSYSSHLFDPRTHFKDGNGRFSEMSEFVSLDGCDSASVLSVEQQLNHEEEGFAQVEIIVGDLTEEAESIMNPGKYEIDGGACNSELVKSDKFEEEDLSCLCAEDDVIKLKTSAQRFFTRKHPVWCEVFVCFSPEYRQSSLPWKIVCWVKIFIISMTHMLFLYFVIVCIGATAQVNNTKAKLPYVHKAIYKHMNEGPVCAFDNRGPDSNITTFADENAAHEAGFLVLHCGACGACSSWENLKIEYTTRNTMSELANECAKVSLFGGDDAITDCLMAPEIGFEPTCAQCWMEDIVCTREHCAFIFLQSQMINNVGNFAVGPNEITSASCEEANCEAGNPGEFVSCSGATRRRMNITSSIARPGEQQCAIVDVKDWNDLFFGSGVA
ncbi:hypothetical protein HJC23_008844 [Cyclotella cryptica]|uniref:Uncharacterized protein n=1 Tax=Cyclotella cryptica TaxID=29204 RepID=A0ABD3QB00_9STRA|eukprot:CCRYP_007511-RA/>CCRYP_007511-RA protein AED:0.01 eAED:0.01 QI:178/1/1/1/1/1/2/1345/861